MQEKHNINSQVITMSNQTPAPAVIPIVANKSADYVKWGNDNNMGQTIYNIATSSPTQSAILDTITTFIQGAGVEYDTLGRPNPEQTYDELIDSVCKDYALYNMFAIQCILNRDGETASLYHVPVSCVRPGKLTDVFGNFDNYCICDDWRKANKSNIVQIKKFDGKLRNGEPQLAVFRDMRVNDRWFATPSWWSAAPYAQADAALAKFYRNEVDGSFRGQTVVSFPYNADDEMKKSIGENIKESFCGPDAASSVLVLFGENGEKVEVSSVNPPDHDVFNQVANHIQYSLCSTNRIHPMLAGLSINVGMAQQSDIYLVLYHSFMATVIQQKRRFILQSLNGLLSRLNMDNGRRNQLRFVDLDLADELNGLTAKNDAIEKSVNDTDGMTGIDI